MPSEWAHAIVTPVFKSGDAAITSNYRPISLTNVSCKIIERIISNDCYITCAHTMLWLSNSMVFYLASASSSSNPRNFWNFIKTLLERKPSPILPSLDSSKSLSQMFATFFSDKILKLHSALKSSSTVSSPHIPPKNLLPYSALFLWSLKMKCLQSSLTHLTLSLILIPFPRLSSTNAYLHSYRPWLTS